MEDPIEVLKEEHEIIKKSLSILEISTRNISVLSTSEIEKLLMFFDEFVDKCHHAKEEQSLFPLIEIKGIPKEGGPIGVMLLEHDKGRELRRAMLNTLKDLEKNFDTFRDYARDFISLLNEHIYKENNILFPMADMILNENDKEQLINDFETIEKRLGNIHEKYVNFINMMSNRVLKNNF
jgi:hemerythrin-like domain-containing protein